MNFWTIGFFILLIPLVGLIAAIPKQRRRAKKGLAERENFLRRTNDMVAILDEDLRIQEVNRSILVRFRTNEESMLRKRVEETPLWPSIPHDRRKALNALRQALDGKQSLVSYTLTDEKGAMGVFEIRIFPVPSLIHNGRDLVCYGKDISYDMGTRQRLKRRDEVETIIAMVSEATFTEGDPRKRVPEILEVTGGFLDARRAFLLQTDKDKTILWENTWSAPGLGPLGNNLKGLSVGGLMPFPLTKGMMILEDIAHNEDLPDEIRTKAEEAGMGSLVFQSLSTADGVVHGYLGFTFDQPTPPNDPSASILLKLLATSFTGLLTKVTANKDIEIFRQSVDAAGQGIAIIGDEGTVIYANRTYQDMTGKANLSAEPAWTAYDGSYTDKVRSLILPLVHSGERWTGELAITGKSGERIDTIESFFPVDTDINDTRYIINIITDISSRKQLESQLIKARKEAEMANRAKSDYLANMSHEIRTPMNAVIGLAYLSLQTDLDPRQRDYLTKINNAAKGLLNIINDILDLSKIEAGRLDLEKAPFSLDEVLDSVADMAAPKAWEKGLKLYIRRPPGMADAWLGDRFRLGQVLLNLVGNAVKFTNKGSVTVAVEDDVTGMLRFSVTDTGIGLSDEQKERLFTPFQQAEASTSRKFGGTGLGLTISKQIVELMEGTISVESELGIGSRFVFTATLDKPKRKPKTDTSAEGSGAESRGTAIVVCGDKRSMGYHMSALESQGYDPIPCLKLKEALENPTVPRVVLLDVDDCDKDPATSAFALSDGADDDFILILSGSMDTQSLTSFAPAGVRHVELPLPYGISRLNEILHSAEVSESEAAISTRIAGSASSGRRILLADDNEINRQVGRELLDGAGLRVDVVEDGKQALEAVKSALYDLVLMDLHMPVMDGYEATARIRENQSGLPIIAMTASALNDVKTEIFDAGFSGYIAKPIDPDQLFASVSETLAIPATAFKKTHSTYSGERQSEIRIAGIETGAALRQVLGRKDRMVELLQAFVDMHSRDADTLRASVMNKDSDGAVFILHALRGSAGHIGANRIKDEAGKLEEVLRKGGITSSIESLSAFAENLEKLLVNIKAYLNPQQGGEDPHPERIAILDELEELIRRSDSKGLTFLQDNTDALNSPNDAAKLKELTKALSLWNYDTALDILDDIRADRG